MKKDFREIEKEQMNAQVPVELGTVIRRIAADRRWSLTKVVTEAIARGVGIDPSTYGIESDAKQPA
jgi:hypothetical protein